MWAPHRGSRRLDGFIHVSSATSALDEMYISGDEQFRRGRCLPDSTIVILSYYIFVRYLSSTELRGESRLPLRSFHALAELKFLPQCHGITLVNPIDLELKAGSS